MKRQSFFDWDVSKERADSVRLGFIIMVLTGILSTSLIIRLI